MIYITRLNHTSVVLNCELIEHVETTPDTVITLTTGEKLRVLEPAEEIVARVVEYRRSILAGTRLTRLGEADQETGTRTDTNAHGRG